MDFEFGEYEGGLISLFQWINLQKDMKLAIDRTMIEIRRLDGTPFTEMGYQMSKIKGNFSAAVEFLDNFTGRIGMEEIEAIKQIDGLYEQLKNFSNVVSQLNTINKYSKRRVQSLSTLELSNLKNAVHIVNDDYRLISEVVEDVYNIMKSVEMKFNGGSFIDKAGGFLGGINLITLMLLIVIVILVLCIIGGIGPIVYGKLVK